MEESVCATRDRKIPSVLTNNFLRYFFTPPERLVKKYVVSGSRAVDLGCGAGFHTLAMARIVGEKGTVYAVDFDAKAISRLQRRARRRSVDRVIEARAASASEIDFIESGSVHFVLAEGLLCCMTDHAGAIRQITRVLRPDGRAYLSVVKLLRADDPRTVSREEWQRVLSSFHLLAAGETLTSRWAVVGPAGGGPAEEPARAGTPGGHRLPCC
jgi:ubiquinone/menaquinone biosynthesis C-methylase UbiE